MRLLKNNDTPLARLTTGQPASTSGASTVVGLISGSGGVGSSVIACGLAIRATAQRVLLIDTDDAAGGLDLMFGLEHAPGQRIDAFREVRGCFDPVALSPITGPHANLHLLSQPRQGSALSEGAFESIIDSARTSYDVIICDLSDNENLAPFVDRVLVVAGVDVRSCASAANTVRRLHGQDVGVVVRGPGPVPHDAVAIAEFLGAPLVGEVLWEPRLHIDIEQGQAPGLRRRGQIAVGCDQLLENLTTPRPRRRLVG